jgi:hypothetical protein
LPRYDLGWEVKIMAAIDWPQCPAVESIPGKVGGAWVFKDTRMPVSTVFENFESGATIDEIMECSTLHGNRLWQSWSLQPAALMPQRHLNRR